MKEISVCFLMSRFEMGGLEKVQMELSSGLIRYGFKPVVVTSEVNAQAHGLLKDDVPTIALRKNRLVFVFSLLNWLRLNKPDFIITSANDIGCLILLFRPFLFSKSKVLWTQHLSIDSPLNKSKGLKRLKLIFEKKLMRYVLKKSDAIVSVSNSIAEEMRLSLGSNLVVNVIHNPVINHETPYKIQQAINWPWDDFSCPTIIFVGRIVKVKRLDLLIHACAQLQQKMPIRLLVIGDGSEYNQCKNLADDSMNNETCKFIGTQANPLPWISKSDLLVLCSDAEGFGLVLVEAMACGTQVVSTDCQHGPAEILEHGKYGKLVPTNDANALAVAIEASLKKPVIIKEALIKRASVFGAEQAVAKYFAVLQSMSDE